MTSLRTSAWEARSTVYLLKIEAKSLRDTGHCKDIESSGNLGPIAGF